jgi:hypothetical protein
VVCWFIFAGSPFEFTVGPIAGGGSHKVHAAGRKSQLWLTDATRMDYVVWKSFNNF